MKECVQPYYIRDGEILDCESFDRERIDRGKSIYEVLRFVGSRGLFVQDHLNRLFASLKMEGIKPWLEQEDILRYLNILIRKNNSPDGNIKIVVNAGADGSRCFLAYFVAHRYPLAEDYENGVKTICFPFERENPNKKLWRPEFRNNINEALSKSGAFEALLLDSEGFLPEASKANVFAVRGSSIITAPSDLVLPGITRKIVLKICQELAIPVLLRKIAREELGALDGIFLTGTSLNVLPVCSVDQQKLPVGDPSIRRIIQHFENFIQKE